MQCVLISHLLKKHEGSDRRPVTSLNERVPYCRLVCRVCETNILEQSNRYDSSACFLHVVYAQSGAQTGKSTVSSFSVGLRCNTLLPSWPNVKTVKAAAQLVNMCGWYDISR